MDRLKLAILYGSVREGRLCDKVVAWVTAQVQAHAEFDISIVDPRSFYQVLALNGPHDVSLQGLRRTIADADAYLVVTPEYNHSYPAALKLVIDTVYEQWQAKPVAFVSYGGASGGIRAVEHLRQVFAELHAVGIRDSVSFPNAWEQFAGEESPAAPPSPAAASGQTGPKAQARRSIAVLLQRLQWWATALRHARHVTPYNQTAA